VLAQRTVAEALDEELSAAEHLEKRLIIVVEEVEAAIAVLAFFDGVGDLRERLEARCGIVDGREELDVAVVGCPGDGGQIMKRE
jgi:hypothetical protein